MPPRTDVTPPANSATMRAFVHWIRAAAPYVHAFRGKAFVIAFGGEVVADESFLNVVHDLNLLHSLGIQLVVVHGCRPQVEAILSQQGFESRYAHGMRVTDADAMDCVLEAAGCCGACGAGAVENYVALNLRRVEDYYSTQGCNGLLCGPCPEPLPYGEVPPFVATCESGRCQVVELLEAGVFTCERDSDCRLRHGLGCCEGCGGDVSRLVSVGDETKLLELVCPSEGPGCPDCGQINPDCPVPVCNAGTCVLAGCE